MAKSTKRLSKEWVAGSEIREKYGLSEELLKRLRDDGVLQPKTHWINIGRRNAVRPTYRYHLKRCDAAILALTEPSPKPPPPAARLEVGTPIKRRDAQPFSGKGRKRFDVGVVSYVHERGYEVSNEGYAPFDEVEPASS